MASYDMASDICQALPTASTEESDTSAKAAAVGSAAQSQGLTLDHFKARCEHFLWDMSGGFSHKNG